jgi:carboxymethylenebutenolidase
MKLEAKMIDIETKDGVCDAFVTFPTKPSQHRAVLFYMDGFGLRPYLYKMAEKLASRGYYVLVPNLFYRYKRVPVFDFHFPLTEETLDIARDSLRPLIRGFDLSGAMRDAEAYLNFFGKQKEVSTGRVGVTGYCMGGGLAIRTAAKFPDRVAAVASFHAGHLVTDTPSSHHLLLSHIKAEIYIAHADNDPSMPLEQIALLKRAFHDANVKYEMELYVGAAHGFTMADLPMHDKTALDRHWIKLFELFRRSLT